MLDSEPGIKPSVDCGKELLYIVTVIVIKIVDNRNVFKQ